MEILGAKIPFLPSTEIAKIAGSVTCGVPTSQALWQSIATSLVCLVGKV